VSSSLVNKQKSEINSERHYDWKRYWRPRGEQLSFSDDGFLFSPGKYNPKILPFEKIAEAPCLVLLGEPGIGKTSAMKAERDVIDADITTKGDQVLWRDLRSYGDSDRLICKVFGHPKFQAWAAGSHRLHLFLDSFDECRLEIKKLAALLADELREYKGVREQLVLRIACRTADWPDLLESALKDIWGSDAVKAYELAPLTEDDVRLAAAGEKFDPDQFLSEVHEREVGPLAAKPVTLRLLINLYRHQEKLPLTQTELYARGCKLLAKETSPSYVEAGQTGNLLPAARTTVAARIAAPSPSSHNGLLSGLARTSGMSLMKISGLKNSQAAPKLQTR
jgi:predicted NACHT family NTPase